MQEQYIPCSRLSCHFQVSGDCYLGIKHNPYYDNGIKFFSSEGTKLSDEIELAIEAELDKDIECVESSVLGKAVRLNDALQQAVILNFVKVHSRTK